MVCFNDSRHRTKSAFGVALVATIGLFGSAEAATVDVDFTINNTYYTPGNGYASGIAGNVTGEILGLTEGGTSPAYEVAITSVPAGSGLFTGVYDLTNVTDSFTLNSVGSVTNAYFIDYGAGLLGFNLSSSGGFAYLQNSNTCNADDPVNSGCAVASATVPGYGTVTFSLAPTVTPLPGSLPLLASVLTSAMALLRWRRKSNHVLPLAAS